jgi:hypothetical protein
VRWWTGIAALAAATVFAGCGGGKGAASSSVACRNEASVMADRADAMLRHYAGMVYPADMSYLLFKASFDWYTAHSCAPGLLGTALGHRLTRSRQRRFVSLLPNALGRSVSRAIAAASE